MTDIKTREDYRFANAWCEVCHNMRRETSVKWVEFGIQSGIKPVANGGIHHICKGTSARVDVETNIIALSMGVHNWVERYVKPGFVLCCWIKMKKGELDFKIMEEISGRGFEFMIDGDDVREQCDEFDWLVPKRLELLDRYNMCSGDRENE